MTDRSPQHVPTPPHTPPPEPVVQEYPKAMVKAAEPAEPAVPPHVITVADATTEAEARKAGYVDGPAFEQAQQAKKK